MDINIIGWCDMEKEFLEEFCVCRAEFENDDFIWGEDITELKEDENSPRMKIFEKCKDEDLTIPF